MPSPHSSLPNTTFQELISSVSLPRLDAEILASFVLKLTRPYLLTHPETKVSRAKQIKYQQLAKKRQADQPLAYLIKQREFYGLDFKVSPAVLIPRPETELLVEQALLAIKQSSKKKIAIDIGTGSGAIIISLAKQVKQLFPHLYPQISFWASDISLAALTIAKCNAKHHRLTKKISFNRGDLLAPLKDKLKKYPANDLIITANLPYLTPTQIKTSPTIQAEPYLALNGDRDGLKYYRQLFKQLRAYKLSNKLTLLAEIDPSQKKTSYQLASLYFPGAKISVTPDLAGRARLLTIIT